VRTFIVEFASIGTRDKWARKLGNSVVQNYKNYPMIAATLSEKRRRELSKVRGVHITPEVDYN